MLLCRCKRRAFRRMGGLRLRISRERERAADEPRVEPSLRVDVSALERNSAPMSRSSAHAAPTSFDALRDEASSVTPPSPWLASTHRASLVVGEGDERVSLAVETSGANVRIEARTANAGLAEALEHGIPVLRAALEEHGVHLAQLHARSDGDRQHGSAAREDPRALRGPRIVARSPTPVEAATPCTLEQARTRMTRIIA